LNRCWDSPNKETNPEIYHLKHYMNQLEVNQIVLFCDLHCHSRKLNSFFYGCNIAAKGGITSWTKTRLLPRIVAKKCAYINLKGCYFKVDPEKTGTGRVVLWD
jgi:hypothetical protein